MTVKFKSINTNDTSYYPEGHKYANRAIRTVTLDVDGIQVTRKVPDQFEGTIEDYITALAAGLQIEADKAASKAIETPSFKANDVIIANPEV